MLILKDIIGKHLNIFIMSTLMVSFVVGMLSVSQFIKQGAKMELANLPEYLTPVPIKAVDSVQITSIEDLNFVDNFDSNKHAMRYATQKQQKAIDCLSVTLFLEARNQSRKGVIAVGRVIKNRVGDPRWPNTVCQVVEQGPKQQSWKDKSIMILRKNKCQFSALCDGKPDDPLEFMFTKDGELIELEREAWENSYQIAKDIVLYDRYKGVVHGATNYHASYVNPNWKNVRRVAIIDDHLFYIKK